MGRSALPGGLVSRACSACRRTGQPSVQRLQADWSAKHAVFAGGLVSGACLVCGRTGRSSEQRLQADWSVDRTALTGGLVDRACSDCRRTGRSKMPPRSQVDWSVQHTGACRWAGLSTVQRGRRSGQSCVHRLRAAWPVVRAALADGMVGRACSACSRTGQGSLQRLHADWLV